MTACIELHDIAAPLTDNRTSELIGRCGSPAFPSCFRTFVFSCARRVPTSDDHPAFHSELTTRCSTCSANSLSQSATLRFAVTVSFVVVGDWRSAVTLTSRSPAFPSQDCLSPPFSVLVPVTLTL